MERANGSKTGRHTLVVQHLATAIAELKAMDEEADRAMSRDNAPSEESPRIACAFCGKPMMATATICGFCWRRPIGSKGAGVSTR